MTTSEFFSQIENDIAAGKIQKAYDALSALLSTDPSSAHALYLKGQCEFKTRNFQNAIESLRAAQNLDPENLTIINGLGKAFMARTNYDEAIKVFSHAKEVLKNSQNEQKFLAFKSIFTDLTNLYHHQKQFFKALKTLVEAEKIYPHDSQFTYMRGHLASQSVPLWHIPMLAHHQRNIAYEEAINATVKPGDIVLDIGTGSGLLAMMAARSGASHVYACEANKLMAEVAKEVITSNGYSDHITILDKHSTDLVVGKDIPTRADVLVTEIFDNAVTGEGVLPSLRHAWQNLLQKDARLIPQKAKLYGALIETPHFENYHSIGDVCGFDLSMMNALSHPLSYKDVNFDFAQASDEKILSTPFLIQDWDFSKRPSLQFSQSIQVEIVSEGVANGILMWFDLCLSQNVTLSTQSPHPQDHWREVCQLLSASKKVQEGSRLQLEATYDQYYKFNIDTEQ